VAKYILKRIGYTVLTVFVLVTLTFFMMQLLPGDPFTGQKNIPADVMASMKAKYGLDKPVWQQYFIYIGNCLHGDLGISLNDKRPVTEKLNTTFPVSFDLGMRALIFATIFGILLGILASIKRGTGWDTFAMIVALIGVSVPSFIVASLLQYFFALKLFEWTGIKFFPVTGWGTFAATVLPAFAMGFGSLATISRLMRTSMLDVLNQDYIKTAKAKGLSNTQIIWRHAVRNAIMPVVTVLGPIAAAVLTGGFVVESIFSIPGMGRSFVQSIQNLDYTMITGTTLFYGTFLIVANLVVDLVYGLIDPRVKITKEAN
jgi:oligopeptide transport system permease protein